MENMTTATTNTPDSISPFECDSMRICNFKEKKLFIIEKDEKYGVIDRDSKIILPLEYEYINDITEDIYGVFEIEKNGKYGISDLNGKILLPCEYNNLIKLWTEGDYLCFMEKDRSKRRQKTFY